MRCTAPQMCTTIMNPATASKIWKVKTRPSPVNPARSTGVALFEGGWAISQLWLFWVAPIAGAVLAGLVYNWLGSEDQA